MGKILDKYRSEYSQKKACCVGGTRIIAFPMWAFIRWHVENGLDSFDDNYRDMLQKTCAEDDDFGHIITEVLNTFTSSIRADGGKGPDSGWLWQAWEHSSD